METPVLNVVIPDHLKDYVEAEVEARHFQDPVDYVRHLMEQDREQKLSEFEDRLAEAAAGETFSLPLAQIEKGGLVDFLRRRLAEPA